MNKATTTKKAPTKKVVQKKTVIKKTTITVRKPMPAKKPAQNKVRSLTTFEQKILDSNLGERLKKERLEVRVAEKSLKSAQVKAVKAEEILNDAKETSLTIREEFAKLQNELRLSKIEADESSSEAKRREIELIEQTVRTQAAVSKRLEEEYQITIKQIEDVEAKALLARHKSDDTYNKISEEVLSDVEINMKTQIEDELDEMGDRTRVMDLVRSGVESGITMEEELQYMNLRNQEAIVSTDAAREEASFLKDADGASKEAYAKEVLEATDAKVQYKLVAFILLFAVVAIFGLIITLLLTGVI